MPSTASLSTALLADFQHEAGVTRRVLEAIPEDRYDWKPHDKSMTLGALASHVAESPTWAHSMLEDELDCASMADWKPFVAENRAELLAAHDKNCAGFREIVADKDDAFLASNWKMRSGDKILMEAPKHAAMRSTVVHHNIHHRGQLTVYLRMLDVPVPSTYGPTADYPDFG
ncbi:MAG: DUF664 domain-containing protein [bacterium]|nr:DUF664 domain-containing protein [bacterium]